MDIETAKQLRQYNELLKIKPPKLQTKYPFSSFNEEDVVITTKRIELIYQHMKPDKPVYTNNKKINKVGGRDSRVTVFTL